MTIVSVFEFRNNLASYLKLVEDGEELEITKFDKPVATVAPTRGKRTKTLRDFRGFLGHGGETGVEYVNKIRSKPGFTE